MKEISLKHYNNLFFSSLFFVFFSFVTNEDVLCAKLIFFCTFSFNKEKNDFS